MTRKLIDPKTIDLFVVNPTRCGHIWEVTTVEQKRLQLTEEEIRFYKFHDVTQSGYSVWKLKEEYQLFIKYLTREGRSVAEVVAEYLKKGE